MVQVCLVALLGSGLTQAQVYVGAMGGVATLSGDASSVVNARGSSFSSYQPRNGATVELLAGRHCSDYVSLQADYIWNRNPVTLSAGAFLGGTQQGFTETRSSSQQGVIGDVLVYFRGRNSLLRPYLAVGAGLVHFSSTEERIIGVGNPTLPPRTFSATQPALHVPVGMDVRLGRGWAFRYQFSETITGNPIREQLTPRPPNSLKNFQSLFGLVKRF